MSYRLTLKSFREGQEAQNKAIQELNERVQELELQSDKSWWSWFKTWAASKGF